MATVKESAKESCDAECGSVREAGGGGRESSILEFGKEMRNRRSLIDLGFISFSHLFII